MSKFYTHQSLVTPWTWKFLPIVLAYIFTTQPEYALNPYLLRELAITPGYCSYEFAPIKLSYHVPIGLQQTTSKSWSPELNGIATVPYPYKLWRPC